MTSELPDKGADLTWRNPNYEKDNLAFAARMLHISNLGYVCRLRLSKI
jgi:hypothetical protein